MAAFPKPPTSMRGYVSDDMFYGVLGDFLETVPDLTWPLSVPTYAQMRRDPQLTAILTAYELPIRRATWTLSPEGCRPEVAALVADDLGLPLTGTDVPGAARTRGVSWREHLRAALSQLTFGHAGFEMEAEVRGGRARLTILSERLPHTIGRIYSDRAGRFEGITQDLGKSLENKPEISADRMVWYTYNREGASWQGTSLLRPAYAAWLLKREMLRVHATSNRRFGMGVPTVRELPGTVATLAQHAAAAQFAQQARVGDQGGGALPAGFVLELIGLSGSVPDTLAFIRFLDQQMSRMALAGFLDLGETSNGSRALGESFVDLFMLSLLTIAEDIADTVTRQVCARIVEWNWGPDEPVPKVVVADIGSRREVTAQSLGLLLQSGALSADPALEEYIRREWRLPERVAAPAAPQVTVPPPTPAVPVAAKKRARRAPTAGQMALPIVASTGLRRDLTAVEAASGADFSGIQQDYEDAQTNLANEWATDAEPWIGALATAAAAAITAGLLADLGSLVVPDDLILATATTVAASMTTLGEKAAGRAAAEAAAQGITLPAGQLDQARIDATAEAVVRIIAGGYSNGAARAALLVAAPDVTATVVEQAVRDHLVALAEASDRGWIVSNLSAALSMAENDGRMATFAGAPAGAVFTSSELLDSSTCAPCLAVDGEQFPDLAAAVAAYPTGRYVGCLGADRCRGQLIMTAG